MKAELERIDKQIAEEEEQRATEVTDLLRSEALLEQLETCEPGTFAVAYPDPALSELFNSKNQYALKMAEGLSNYGEKHPNTVSLKVAIENLELQIDQRIKAILSGLRIKTAVNHSIIEELDTKIEEAQQVEYRQSRIGGRYLKLKGDLETLVRFRDSLRLRLLQETVDAQLAP